MLVRGDITMKTAQEQYTEKPFVLFESAHSADDRCSLDRCLGLERIRLRGYRRVLWQRCLWEQTGQHPAQGLAIPHEEVDIAFLNLDNKVSETAFYTSDPAAKGLSSRIGKLEEELQERHEGPLVDLVSLFSLTEAEADLLMLCVAGEIDPRLRRLYGYLHDDATYCAATPWLARMLFAWDETGYVSSESSLVRWLLASPRPGEEEPWSPTARWSVDPRITGYLTGQQFIPPSLSPAAWWLKSHEEPAYEPESVGALRQLVVQVDEQVGTKRVKLAQLVGTEGVGRKTWAARVCAGQGMEVLCLDAPRALRTDKKDDGAPVVDRSISDRLVRAEREALLRGCALYWDRADRVLAEVWSALPFKASLQFFGVEQPISLPLDAPFAEIIPFALPAPGQAQALWTKVLHGQSGNFDIPALAERFTLTPGEILKVAPEASRGHEALWQACRSFSHGRLGRLATLLPTPYTWDDIVLPKETASHLHEIEAHVAHRVTVLDTWGFGQKRPLGRGVSALFAGPSGTGKTMTAQVLAASIDVVLFRIDLASVVSKYVGETEKNLRQIFDEAERLNAVLFFDEADALFGKRTQVRDAHDRYANIEVNYLLQRMESYEGLAILATNRKGDIDSAFLRRLRFIVDFPLPDTEERLAIWQRALPEQAPDGTPLLGEIDWKQLARGLKISGASIKDIALRAAFLACSEGTKIEMNHLFQAARREQLKHGRVIGQDTLGR